MTSRIRHPVAVGATAFLAAALATLILAAPVAGAVDGLDSGTETTYRVIPTEERIEVRSLITLTNDKRPDRDSGQHFSWSTWGDIRVPREATDLVISGKKVRHERVRQDSEARYYRVTFPELRYGKSRTVEVAYDLRGGEGSALRTRFEPGYLHLCWPGQPGDRMVTILMLSDEYTLYHPAGQDMMGKIRVAGEHGLRIIQRSDTAASFGCTEAVYAPAQHRIETATAGVVVEAWPEDVAWGERIADEVDTALPWLEDLFGGPMPSRRSTIRETSKQAYPYSTGDIVARDRVLAIGESAVDPGEVSVRFARLWLADDSIVSEPWLREGIAAWAGYATARARCPEVPEYGFEGDPDLSASAWYQPEPGDGWAGWAMWDYESAMACHIVETAADIVGRGTMADIIGAMFADPEATPIDPLVSPSPFPADAESLQIGTETWLELLFGEAAEGQPDPVPEEVRELLRSVGLLEPLTPDAQAVQKKGRQKDKGSTEA